MKTCRYCGVTDTLDGTIHDECRQAEADDMDLDTRDMTASTPVASVTAQMIDAIDRAATEMAAILQVDVNRLNLNVSAVVKPSVFASISGETREPYEYAGVQIPVSTIVRAAVQGQYAILLDTVS